ncbi:MAG: flagellar protein FlgN [Deltaproteobacteria bacterium]|nr:flagellar protein FlgN [Deltaproteobacteria bacterium]
MEIQLIIDHLVKEIALFKELVTILQIETEDLVSRDYKGLYETISRKEHLLVRIGSMGKIRQKLISDCANGLGITGEQNLTSIIDKTGGSRTEELKNCRDTIYSLAESVKELNDLNSKVIKGSLENISKTLGFLGNFLPNSNYKASGAFEGFAIKGSRLNEGA